MERSCNRPQSKCIIACKFWAEVALLLLATLPSCYTELRLQPSVDRIAQSDYAVFNCSYPCPQEHTIFWLVGDAESLSERSFVKGKEKSFTARSGLSVKVEDVSTCGDPTRMRAIQQLRINGSSAEHNRTAVQCVAVPTVENAVTYYSSYSLMLINNEASPTPSPSSSLAIHPTPTTNPTSTLPCPAPVTHTEVVTKEVRLTLTLSPTGLPEPIDCKDLDIHDSLAVFLSCSQ